MSYVAALNAQLARRLAAEPPCILFGQNVAGGSCLSGLTRGIEACTPNRIINTPNSENALVGLGLGLMASGVDAIFCMKQLDFLLLGIDQLCNSYTVLRRLPPKRSFTIVAIVVDSGYEGPQASFNRLADFCSIANIDGYCLTNQVDIDSIFTHHLNRPGMRILAVSQRLFRQELLRPSGRPEIIDEGAWHCYQRGRDLTIVAYNFTFPQALELAGQCQQQGISASLFSLNAAMPVDATALLQDLQRTGRLLLLDDSKTHNKPYARLVQTAQQQLGSDCVQVLDRDVARLDASPNADRFDFDTASVLAGLGFVPANNRRLA